MADLSIWSNEKKVPASEVKFDYLRWVWILYNFTRTDIKTIVAPQAFFGLALASSGLLVAEDLGNTSISSSAILSNSPLVLLWLWLNLLIFTLANQRLPSSILEDSHNKPWRNLPSQLVSPEVTRKLLIGAIGASWILSSYLKVWSEFASLMVFMWIYNDLGGSEDHFLLRNFFNAAGYVCFGLGALKLAAKDHWGAASEVGVSAASWSLLAGFVVATTIQMQDLQDQVGDRKRNRKTFPLVWGDRFCRWSVAVLVIVWSLICALFWNVSWVGYCLPLLSGGIVACRVLYYGYNGWSEGAQRARHDEATFAFWCLWLGTIYALPLMKSVSQRLLDTINSE